MTSASTDVLIKFERKKVTSTLFSELDACFQKHGFTTLGKASFMPLDPKGPHEIFWKDIQHLFSQGDIVSTGYLSKSKFSIRLTIVYHDGFCDRLSLNAGVKGARPDYTTEERAKALKLQDLCLDLHRQLDAYDTTAKANYHEEPWFRFSADEWKPLGDLPIEP